MNPEQMFDIESLNSFLSSRFMIMTFYAPKLRKKLNYFKTITHDTETHEILSNSHRRFALQQLQNEIAFMASEPQEIEFFDIELQMLKDHISLVCLILNKYITQVDMFSHMNEEELEKHIANTINLEEFKTYLDRLLYICTVKFVTKDMKAW